MHLEADEIEVIDELVEQFRDSVEDELRAKIESLTAINKIAVELFEKILKGYTFNDQVKKWLELNKARE